MMTRFFLSLVILFLFFDVTFAQENCGTPAPKNFQEFNTTTFSRTTSIEDQTFCVNIYFHIVQKGDGSDGFDATGLIDLMGNLNAAYNQYGIFFSQTGFDYINSDELYDFEYNANDDSTEDVLFNRNNQSGSIDFYLIGSLTKREGDSLTALGGKARKVLTKKVAVTNSSADGTTPIHEIGHALNSLHTHETSYGLENIPRSDSGANCMTAGDKLCDTPADPNLDGLVNFSCNYDTGGLIITRNGLPYSPDTHNYMSYSRHYCRDEFTIGQVRRMKNALMNAPVLQPIRSTTCTNPSITGPSTVCSDNSETFILENAPAGASVIWSVSSSNLSYSNSTDSSVEVKVLNNTVHGEGTITATVNGFEVTETVHVGRPAVVYGISGNSGDKPVKSTASFHVTSVNNNSYHWSISTLNNDCDPNNLGNPLYGPKPKFVVNGGYFSSTATGSSVTVFWGSCAGRYKISCRAVNSCGSTGVGDIVVDVFDGNSGGGDDGCPEGELNTYPNPVTQGTVTVNLVDPLPCPPIGNQRPANVVNNEGTIQTWVTIYDLSGMEKYTGTFTGNDFTITGLNLPHGLYVIHVNTSAGFSKQEMLAVD